jgi:hypothetical protein
MDGVLVVAVVHLGVSSNNVEAQKRTATITMFFVG